MPQLFDCSEPEQLVAGLRAARRAIAAGELVVTPTDTVYGIAADAFQPAAVQRLLTAKGRGRENPPPVLVPDVATLGALSAETPPVVSTLVDAYWPGALTLVCRAAPTLSWDLGETAGTVALRMPDDAVCLELLRDTGPLAVSSANRHGLPAAVTAAEAQEMLGDTVAVYLDGGPSRGGEASTILDMTGVVASGVITVLRRGAIPTESITAVAQGIELVG